MDGDCNHGMVGAQADCIYTVGVTWRYGSRAQLL